MPLDLTPQAVETRAAQDGRHTVARFKAHRPHAYQLILERIKQGASFNAITREFRDHGIPLHESTLSAIANAAFTPKELRDHRAAAFAKGARLAADTAAEHLSTASEEVDQILNPKERVDAHIKLASTATVMAGVFNQNAELLAGNATVIVGETEVYDHDQFRADLARLKSLSPQPVRDITAEATASPSPGVCTPATPTLSAPQTQDTATQDQSK